MDLVDAPLMTTQNTALDLFEETEPTAPNEIVRPDRNLEKWPIWEPSSSRRKPEPRIIRRDIKLANGNTGVATVEVGFSNKGCLTTEDQKTFYALVKYWEESGRPTENVCFSRQRLARILRKQWGSKVNSAITSSLMRLRFTPFTWDKSYFDSSIRETIERIDTFNILADLQLTRRSKEGHTTRETSFFRFNGLILKNLLANHTKPVYLDVILSFQSEIAQLLYTHLDLVMSDKCRYERKTKELFNDIRLDGTAYRYPSKRAQMLEPALCELQGKALPTGCIKSIRLQRTVDGKDFKIVVQKGPKNSTPAGVSDPQTPKDEANLFSSAIENPASLAARKEEDTAAFAQAKHFYAIFFQSGDSSQPTAKELALAQAHLERLGEERARFLVQFAFEESRKTKFAIQNYAGIGQYEGRVIARYKAAEKKQRAELEIKEREKHETHYLPEYMNYLKERHAQMARAPSAAFQKFQSEEETLKQKRASGTLAKHPVMQRILRDSDKEEDRLKRFAERFAANNEESVMTFWQWDAKINPNPFAELAPRP